MSDTSAELPAGRDLLLTPDRDLLLSPQATGSSSTSLSSGGSGDDPDARAARKARRQTAFYPNTARADRPLKPFSRSAAKRESVMALGSIEHLQHYFTKTGLAAPVKCVHPP
jgi:hypothetical protein